MVRIPVPRWLYDLTGMGCGVVLLIASVLYAIGSKGIGRILAIVFAILLIYYIYDTIGDKFSKNNSVTNHKIEEEVSVNSRKLSTFVAIAKPIDAKNYLMSHPELLNVKLVDTLQR